MTGRPSSFTQETADSICARLMEGESLRQISLDDGMPSQGTVMRWLAGNLSFQEQYARAREAQAEYYATEIVDISDNGLDAVRDRLRVDARKWVAAKLLPKKYGDKLLQELSGPNGGPIQTESRVDLSGLTAEQLEALASIGAKEG